MGTKLLGQCLPKTKLSPWGDCEGPGIFDSQGKCVDIPRSLGLMHIFKYSPYNLEWPHVMGANFNSDFRVRTGSSKINGKAILVIFSQRLSQ